MEQTSRLLLRELEDRDARRAGQHLRDLLLAHLGRGALIAVLPLVLALGARDQQLLLVVAETGGALEILSVDRRLLLQPDARDLLVELPQIRRRGHALDAQPGAGLVDQVDRLVGQEPVGDVPIGQLGRRCERLVGDRDAVVRLVAIAQALQDVDGERDARLGHLNRLETALQRRVLLDVLAVLVERRRADRLQFAAGEHRLQNGRRVDRALGCARPDEGVDLVDEQNHVAAGLDLLQHLLQALLEITAVTRTSHQGAEVEGVDLLVAQRLGHVTAHDLLGEALDAGGLADARFADQHRVVLCAARQHGHHALDLFLAPDHRVELVLARGLREVAAELVENGLISLLLRGLGRPRRGRLLFTLEAGQQLQHLIAHAVEVGAELDQHLGGDALTLTDQPQQNVLGADVGVVQLQRLAHAQLEHLLGARGERNMPGGRLLPLADDLFDLVADSLQRDAERLQRLGRDALALVDQPEEDMFRPDVVVVQHAGLVLSQHDDPTSSVSKPVEQWTLLHSSNAGVRAPGRGTRSVYLTVGGVPVVPCSPPAHNRRPDSVARPPFRAAARTIQRRATGGTPAACSAVGGFVGLTDLSRDAASRRDRHALFLGPRANIGGVATGRTARLGRRALLRADLTTDRDKRGQSVAQTPGIVFRQVDLISTSIQTERDTLGGVAAIKVIGQDDMNSLSHLVVLPK